MDCVIMRKTVYISAPITGHENYVVQHVFSAAEKELLKRGYNTINPLELKKDLEGMFEHVHPSTGQYIGYDISHLIDKSEAIYFCRGWHESKGCQLEFAAAKIYGKEIMFE